MKIKIYKLLSGARQKFSEACAHSGSVIRRMTALGKAMRGKQVIALALTVYSGTAYAQTTYTFNYTGITQTISLPAGNYSIECWGADGGKGFQSSQISNAGRGGYSAGIMSLTAAQTISIYVGGAGTDADGTTAGQVCAGGFNGGGSSGANNYATTTSYRAGGGGGGTDVRVGGTALSNRVIVAGGGGGGVYSISFAGGNGGGTSGGNGGNTYHGTGGTQFVGGTANGSTGNIAGTNGALGTGGNGGTATSKSGGGGGGGGYYGGGGGATGNSSSSQGGGGGGSGYIGGVSSGTTIMFGQTGFVSNPDLTGNGRVLITELCNISLTASGANSVNPIICAGQSLTLTTNAVSNYSWTTGVTGTNQIVVSPTSNTVYGVTGTSSLACTAGANISVTVSPGLPVLTVNSTTNSVCLGDSVTLTASGALSYTWTNGVNNGQIFLPTSTITYTISGENGCGITTAMTTVSVAPLPVTAISSSTLVCASTAATLTGGGANSYTWTIGNQTMQGNTVIVAPDSLSIYTVTGSVGACVGTDSITIVTKANPTLHIAATSSNVCAGKSVTITVNGADTYTWIPSTLSGTLVVVSPTTPTLYQVSGTNSLSCTSGTSQVVVTEAAPNLNVSGNALTVCPGGSATLTASGNAHAYTWNAMPGTNVNVVNPNTTTVYTVVSSFTTGANCSTMQTIAVEVFQPTIAISAASSVCPGAAVTLTAGPGTGYIWSTGSIFHTISLNPTVTAIYSVSATVSSTAQLSCPATNSVQVTVYPKPSVTASASRSEICRGEVITLTASGAENYEWSNNAGSGATVNFSTNLITTLNLSVTGTDNKGCKDTAFVAIEVNSCTGIDDYANHKLRLYPNPNNGQFVIESEVNLELELSNELGQLIRTLKLDAGNKQKISISDLPAGIYFIRGTGSEDQFRQKIIVNK